MSKPDSWVRDRLALDRTLLANERTLLAYVRTSIMLAVAGGTLLKLYADTHSLIIAGWSLMSIGLLIAMLGVYRFRKLANRIQQRLEADEPSDE